MMAHDWDRRVVFAGLGAAALGLGACRPRYEMRFEVEHRFVIDGIQHSVSVARRSVRGTYPNWFRFEGSTIKEFQGEAGILELPGRSPLFMLLVNDARYDRRLIGPELVIENREGVPRWESDGRNRAYEEFSNGDVSYTLLGHEFPLLAQFSDLNKPSSSLYFRAEELGNILPGVELREVVLRATRSRPSSGQVEKFLPWIGVITGSVNLHRSPE